MSVGLVKDRSEEKSPFKRKVSSSKVGYTCDPSALEAGEAGLPIQPASERKAQSQNKAIIATSIHTRAHTHTQI